MKEKEYTRTKDVIDFKSPAKMSIKMLPQNHRINFPLSKEQFKENWNGKAIGFIQGNIRVILSIEDGSWHISISLPHRIPNYAEMKHCRYTIIPDECYMVQIFPPKKEFVNMQENTLHLFEITS